MVETEVAGMTDNVTINWCDYSGGNWSAGMTDYVITNSLDYV